MGQLGFFDLNRRYEGPNKKNDPTMAITTMVPFESFRPKLQAARRRGGLRGSEAERKEFSWAFPQLALRQGPSGVLSEPQ
jgi:IS5 family transposase